MQFVRPHESGQVPAEPPRAGWHQVMDHPSTRVAFEPMVAMQTYSCFHRKRNDVIPTVAGSGHLLLCGYTRCGLNGTFVDYRRDAVCCHAGVTSRWTWGCRCGRNDCLRSGHWYPSRLCRKNRSRCHRRLNWCSRVRNRLCRNRLTRKTGLGVHRRGVRRGVGIRIAAMPPAPG